MTNDDSAENVRRRMAELRRDLECNVREVRRGARVMTDWKFYVRKFPWAVAGAALVAGYLLVPKRKPVVKPDPEMIEELVKQNKIRVESVSQAPDKPSMLQSLLMMGITYAVKAGATYMTQQMAAAAQNKAAAATSPDESHHEPGPSPLHEPWPSVSQDG
jgi:hypothetical protein